ncbi:hypothetical protein LK994_09500 [Ferruginibacter lapsinanis]|uniref:tetratricopeptide repeat protein n=1 Tax=Ferruginibacter lapsinanis TaxID=563172 RepID=UPI001E41F504|nr:hypothetical protein [Ferruginibacter lapsinanis]UEG48871.1 hypothetical protein LK994_09500 [Ferruginibacter lapsinanis]
MKKSILGILSMLILLLPAILVQGQGGNATAKKELPVTTKSKAAKEMALKGVNHFLNIEFASAYEDFSDALKLDPEFTFAQVFMSFLTTGETAKSYAKKALKSAKNKTEGEKLFASLVDEKNNSREAGTEIWSKLHKMYPDCNLSQNFYVVTRASADERFAAAQEYIKKYPKDAWMYNTIAYYYMNEKKDMESAKTNFEKYIALYPKGSNPYDSMGEYYLNNGDLENAEKYYTKSLEIYPFSTSSLNALEKIKTEKNKDKVSN